MSTTEKEQQIILKAQNKQRLAVKGIVNRLLSQFSFKNVKCWRDIYRFTGYDDAYIAANFTIEQCDKQVSLVEVKSWCKKLTDDLEEHIRKQNENNGVLQPDKVIQLPSEFRKDSKAEPAHFQTSQSVSTPDESGFNNSNDYGLSPSPKEKAYLYWFQKKAVKEILDKIVSEKKSACLLLASTGTGKTFITAAVDRRLKDVEFEKDRTWGHVNYLSITRATVVEQTKRVNQRFFSINHPNDTEVINIEQLRSRAGQIWIKSWVAIENGEEVEKYEWKKMIAPCVLFLDECQAVKNQDSIQHKLLVEYSNIKEIPTTQLFISATPFTRVSEAKAFAIATHKDISHITGIPGSRLSATSWPTYAAAIAAPSPPDEYNEAAVERLMKDLDDYIVRVKGVRWQFNALNNVEIIDFLTNEEREEYDGAWQRYLIRKAKLEESVTDNPRFQALVELGIFLAAAEYCKRFIFAERMFRDVQSGKAAVLAVKFKKTIIAVTKILHEKYGVDRNNISLIWGGGQTQLTAKQKLKAKIREKMELFEEAGVSMEDLMLEDVEERVLEDLPPELRLGNQSKEERQKEIDRFQSGRSNYCIFTYKAGGVGLSLHHTDEQTNVKVRRQKSGYAVVGDIPKVPVRPRKVTIGPTWSPIELVQGCGRVPRLTSLSDTEQNFLYYRGTVEEEQAFVVTHRLKCLKQVVRQHENWMELINNHTKAREISRQLIESKQLKEDSQDDLSSDGEGEEE
jgi:hypothetical protein